jgi:thiamine pyrophosphokinase
MERLPTSATVIAADSGVDRALQAHRRIAIAIGDFDSVTAKGLVEAEVSGADIRRYPIGKDQTDLELAIDAAIELDPRRIVFAAMAGGRSDHELASLLCLARPARLGIDVDVVLPGADLGLVTERRTFTGLVGQIFSLVPVGGAAVGVTTNGLHYALDDETLEAGSARGVSNVFTAPVAVVSVTSGVLYGYRLLGGPESR